MTCQWITSWVLVLCSAVVSAGCSSSAESRGRMDAQQQWWAGTTTIYTVGYPLAKCTVDEETGLPLCWIAGCIVEQADEVRERDHNDWVRAKIREDGLPANSYRLREPAVLAIQEMWQRRAKAGEKTVDLLNESLQAGGHRIEAKRFGTKAGGDEGRDAHMWVYPVLDGNVEFELRIDARQVECMQGERVDGVVYLRWPEQGNWRYGAVDLKSKLWLRQEQGDAYISQTLQHLSESYSLRQIRQDFATGVPANFEANAKLRVTVVAITPDLKSCTLELRYEDEVYRGETAVGECVMFAKELVGTKGLEVETIQDGRVGLVCRYCVGTMVGE